MVWNMAKEKESTLLKYSENSFYIAFFLFLVGLALILISQNFVGILYTQTINEINLAPVFAYIFTGFALVLIGIAFLVCGFWCRIKATTDKI